MDYKEKKYQVYLSIGSNIGDRELELENALKALYQSYGEIEQSKVYETPPWGFKSETSFLNMCVGFKTIKTGLQVLEDCQAIEVSQGRERPKYEEGYHSRCIDLDILYYANYMIDTDLLQVPHPRIFERRFVLEPLSDIAGNLIDPVRNKSISELKKDCNDESAIVLYKNKLLTF